MQARPTALARVAAASLLTLAALTVACREDDAPTAPQVQAAASGAATAVRGVVPDSVKRGLNLDITVSGAGFDRGTVVDLERQGVPAAGITTNSTTFVSAAKLVANITVAADADTGQYDVAVMTSSGRKGVGIELLTVLYELVDVGTIAGNWSTAVAINDLGQVVGTSCIEACQGTMDPPPTPAHAFAWTEDGGLEDLGVLPGYSRSSALDINDLGQVLGNVMCLPGDAGCGDGFSAETVLWQKQAERWVVTGLGIPFPTDAGDINNSGQFVLGNRVYSFTGGLAAGETLPGLGPPPVLVAGAAINDAGIVVGQSFQNGGNATGEALAWYRDGAGAWRVLQLGALPAHDISLARAIGEIDESGRIRVAGMSARSSSRRKSGYQPVRWTLEPDGAGGWRVADLEELQFPASIVSADVLGVNTAGEVVGDYFDRQIHYDAAKWQTAGSLETLPKPSLQAARARDIDDAGRIVGSVWDDATNSERAAFWRRQ